MRPVGNKINPGNVCYCRYFGPQAPQPTGICKPSGTVLTIEFTLTLFTSIDATSQRKFPNKGSLMIKNAKRIYYIR